MQDLLFPALLGSAYEQLPEVVQTFHKTTGSSEWQGMAEVIRGNGILANMVAWFHRFPKADNNVPIKVTVEKSVDEYGMIQEFWMREFGGRKFQSQLSHGQGHAQHLMNERFGPITVSLALEIKVNKLYFQPRSWRFFMIPLPKFLLPKGGSFESVENGRFAFDVRLETPFIGLIVAYRGWLEPSIQ